MSQIHAQLLDTCFWDFVDAGVQPESTPLFTGKFGGHPLPEVVAQRFNLPPRQAEATIEAARQEVAL